LTKTTVNITAAVKS